MFGFGKKDKEIAALKSEIEDLQEAKEKDNDINEVLNARNTALNEELQATKGDLAKALARVAELETVTNGLTDHNALLDTQSKRLAGAVHNAQEEGETLKKRIRELEVKISIQSVQLLNAKSKRAGKSKTKKTKTRRKHV